MEEEFCLVDSATTNIILRKIKCFQSLTKSKGNITTIEGPDAVIVGLRRATIILPMGTQLVIKDALFYPDSNHTLLSYKDIRCNGYHIETHNDNKDEYLFITKNDGYAEQQLEKIPSLSTGLYFTYVKPVQHVAYKIIFQNLDVFKTWHNRLGHLGTGMMRKIISNSIGHHMNSSKFSKPSDFVCTACATRKLILRPSYLKLKAEPLTFLERIQDDICHPIHPLTGHLDTSWYLLMHQ
jgi:hypothetical protein